LVDIENFVKITFSQNNILAEQGGREKAKGQGQQAKGNREHTSAP